MRALRYTICCAALVLLGIAMAPLARFLRPLPDGASPFLQLLVGVLPNFGAGLALPILFHVTLQNQILASTRWVLFPNILRAAAFTVGGLILWELAQYFLWSYPMDPYDILATGLGTAVALTAHSLLKPDDASESLSPPAD